MLLGIGALGKSSHKFDSVDKCIPFLRSYSHSELLCNDTVTFQLIGATQFNTVDSVLTHSGPWKSKVIGYYRV